MNLPPPSFCSIIAEAAIITGCLVTTLTTPVHTLILEVSLKIAYAAISASPYMGFSWIKKDS
jgi:hypothetical protein